MPPVSPITTTNYTPTLSTSVPKGSGFFAYHKYPLKVAVRHSMRNQADIFAYMASTSFSEVINQSLQSTVFSNVSDRLFNDTTNLIATSSTTNLSSEEISRLVRFIINNHINPELVAQHIASARKYMAVEGVNFLLLPNPHAGTKDLFIQFKTNNIRRSRSEQFDNYIDHYLNIVDVNKSKIHVSVL